MSAHLELVPTPTPQITYRLLPKSEWSRLEPIFASQNGTMPSPELATVAIAEEDEEIVGMLVLQMIPHYEPAWIKSPRGVDFRALTHELDEVMPPGATVYTSAPNDHIAQLAKAVGFEDTGWKVMSKTLTRMV